MNKNDKKLFDLYNEVDLVDCCLLSTLLKEKEIGDLGNPIQEDDNYKGMVMQFIAIGLGYT